MWKLSALEDDALVQTILDTFTDSDATALTSHTMDIGSGWTAQNGSSYTIQGNRAQTNDSTNNEMRTTGVQNARTSIITNLLTTLRSAGLMFRAADSSNWFAWILGDSRTNYQFVKVVSGSASVPYTPAAQLSANTDYTLQVDTFGDLIACYVNGQCTLLVKDSALESNVGVGMYQGGGGTGVAKFDTISQTALSSCPSVRQLICDGNSLTSGLKSSNPPYTGYPYRLQTLLGNQYAMEQYGVGGQTTEQMNSDAAAQIDVRYINITGVKNICIAWEGINSYVNGGDTAAQAYSALGVYIAARQAAGFKVVVATTLDSQGVADPTGFAAFRAAYNPLVLANSAGADAVVDLAADSRLSDSTNTTYFDSDKIHCNDTGYQVVASLLYPAVAAL